MNAQGGARFLQAYLQTRKNSVVDAQVVGRRYSSH